MTASVRPSLTAASPLASRPPRAVGRPGAIEAATPSQSVPAMDVESNAGTRDTPYRFAGGVSTSRQGVDLLLERGVEGGPEAMATRIDGLLRQVPARIREHTAGITVVQGQDVAFDRKFEREYGIKAFQAVAAGGDGTITFYGGKPYGNGTLFHELAHNLPVDRTRWAEAAAKDDANIAAVLTKGRLAPTMLEHVPDPVRQARWTATLAPGVGVTPYGTKSPGEDIAEAMRFLLLERHVGATFATQTAADGTVRPVPFHEVYPNRTAVLEAAVGERLVGPPAPAT